MEALPPEVRAALQPLRDLLQAARQRGQMQISFDDLRGACSAVFVAMRQADPGGATSGASDPAAVVAAYVVYQYLRRNYPWVMTKDGRDRLYELPGLLDTLEGLQE